MKLIDKKSRKAGPKLSFNMTGGIAIFAALREEGGSRAVLHNQLEVFPCALESLIQGRLRYS
jgi:hypothetical protein